MAASRGICSVFLVIASVFEHAFLVSFADEILASSIVLFGSFSDRGYFVFTSSNSDYRVEREPFVRKHCRERHSQPDAFDPEQRERKSYS